MPPKFDVMVVGGGFAGQAAALQLARARKEVLLVDAGAPRNRFANASHGFLGQDGRAPSTIMEEATRQLMAYPGATVRRAEVVDVAILAEGFRAITSDRSECVAHRIVLAGGVEDELPALPGVKERWGETVLHCPYCHGYEVRDRPIGVIGNGPTSVHQATLLADWGPTTLFLQDMDEPSDPELAGLAGRGVTIERTPVFELVGAGSSLRAARLADGRLVALSAAFLTPRTRLNGGLARQLGCRFEEGSTGPRIQVDEWGRTSVARVFAAGDAALPMHNATLAASSGVVAGIAAHQSLALSRSGG